MNLEKIKKYGFILLGILIFMLVLTGSLGVRDIIDEENAWKSAYTLFFVSFGVLVLLIVAQRLFENNKK